MTDAVHAAARVADDRWLAFAGRASVRFSRWIAAIGVAGMVAIAFLTTIDALLRTFAVQPVAALNEIVALVFAGSIAACLPYAIAIGAHLNVDLLDKHIGPRAGALLEVVASLLTLAFFGFMTWQIFLYANELASQGRVTVILQWSHPPFMYAVAVLFATATLLQVVLVLQALASGWRQLTAHSPRPGDGTWVAGALVLLAALGVYAAWDFDAVASSVKAHPVPAASCALAMLWLLLLAKLPMGTVMGLVGLVGSIFFLSAAPALAALGSNVAGFLSNPDVAVLPLFLLMGSLAAVAGLAEDIYRLAQATLKGFRGGLALATIGGCAGFGAVTGSSIATVATIGKVAIPEMRRRGYADTLIAGSVVAGGTLGQIVPPSTAIIVYALLTEQSIGQLFVGEVVPALITIALYFLTIMLIIRRNPDAAPGTESPSLPEILAALRRAIGVLVLFLLVIGGLYSGIFTATESAAVGVVGACVYALARGKLRRDTIWKVLAEATAIVGMVYILILGAITFSFFIATTGLPEMLASWVGGLDVAPLTLVAVILVMYLALGCVMDSFGLLIITTPIIAPLIVQMGYDLIWWGIIMVMVVETGVITPPFGINLFMLKSMTDIRLATIFRGAMPFVFADLVKLVVLVLVPASILWLPSTMYR